jgi:ribA/ribD-fused uncharacterized protein
METKAWEPIEELGVKAIDTDCETMLDDPERPQKYGGTVVGFCLDDPEGCRSIMDFTTGEGREADEALAALVVRSMRVAAGMQAGGCPYCFGNVLYCDRHDQAKGVAHCDDCGAELTKDQYLEGLRWSDCHKMDRPERVLFYEQDFYVLSNFSAFTLVWLDRRFDTSEAAYHYMKFPDCPNLQERIREAASAHEAFKVAEMNKAYRRPDWDDVKVGIMRDILRAKADQHEYVKRKLLATGDRELVEDSWRDDFWGWGEDRDGANVLGKLWMEIRAELRAAV